MNTFEELGLEEKLIQATTAMGFETPTEIQQKAIPHILNSEQDLIALAQTGTGKTGAFGLACIQKIDADDLVPQLIILSPTRELALQTAKELKKFSKKKKKIKSVALYGGADLGSQARALRNGCQIVVGTPGRTLDFIRRGKLKLSSIRMVVLDEADEMLKMGFQEDLEAILSETPHEKQVLLFSATMPKTIEKIARKYMSESANISAGKRNVGTKMVQHFYYSVHPKDRYAALRRLVDVHPGMYGIIFCRTRLETVEICTQLRKDGYEVDYLNGDLSQKQRDYVMGQFRRQELKVLVATDVAARGLDVDNLTHILNLNLPDDLEVYIHRSGRTGRAGKRGQSLCLITARESRRLRALEKMVGQTFIKNPIPNRDEIVKAQLAATFEELALVEVPEQMVEEYGELIENKLSEYTPKEVLMKLLSVMCGQLKTYANAEDLNQKATVKGKRKTERRKKTLSLDGVPKPKKERHYEGNFTRCRINIGRRNGLKPHRLMGFVNEHYAGKKPDFGRIDIQKQISYFDIDTKAVGRVLKGLNGKSFEGRRIEVVCGEG